MFYLVANVSLTVKSLSKPTKCYPSAHNKARIKCGLLGLWRFPGVATRSPLTLEEWLKFVQSIR